MARSLEHKLEDNMNHKINTKKLKLTTRLYMMPPSFIIIQHISDQSTSENGYTKILGSWI